MKTEKGRTGNVCNEMQGKEYKEGKDNVGSKKGGWNEKDILVLLLSEAWFSMVSKAVSRLKHLVADITVNSAGLQMDRLRTGSKL